MLGSLVLTETMTNRPELSFSSYDRLFPSQDTMPSGGFGNLIALPLQGEPRRRGNSVFVDDNLEPVPDQWGLLASVRRIHRAQVDLVLRARDGNTLDVQSLPEDDEVQRPWLRLPSGKMPDDKILGPLPTTIHATLSSRLFVKRDGLPAALVNKIRRRAAYHNPEFYKKQAARLSTAGTSRIIYRDEVLERFVAIPRGCLPALKDLAGNVGIDVAVEDARVSGPPLDVQFHGELTPVQEQALNALVPHETGILVAPPGVGKTVIAAALVAHRKCSTLVIVHRRQLLEQWLAQLALFLDLAPGTVGRIAGGKAKANGLLDVAMVQSLVGKDSVRDVVAGYGQVIVDECHHVRDAGGCCRRSILAVSWGTHFSSQLATYEHTGFWLVDRRCHNSRI